MKTTKSDFCLAFVCYLCDNSRERLVVEYDRTGDLLVDLASDQTSCHNPYLGGYYPVQVLSCFYASVFKYETKLRFETPTE